MGPPFPIPSEALHLHLSHRRTLLILDGLEPLQNPPGPQEGRLRDPSLQALLRELSAFNLGLCVVTTRLPIADLADYERRSAPRRDLEQLSSGAGARLLQALGVKGDQAELRRPYAQNLRNPFRTLPVFGILLLGFSRTGEWSLGDNLRTHILWACHTLGGMMVTKPEHERITSLGPALNDYLARLWNHPGDFFLKRLAALWEMWGF